MSWKKQFIDALHPSRAIEIEDERAYPRHSGDYRHAAVLVPITDRPDPGVILTRHCKRNIGTTGRRCRRAAAGRQGRNHRQHQRHAEVMDHVSP